MKQVYFVLSFLLLQIISYSQSISGVINSYAAVINIAGPTLTVSSSAGFVIGDQVLIHQSQGAAIVTTNNSSFGDITALNSAGLFEFKDIIAIAGNTVTLSGSLVNSYNTTNGSVQMVSVPKYCQATVTSSLTCAAWNGTIGGILAIEVGTLTLNADIDVSAKGFRGGAFATSFFCCSNGNYVGAYNTSGGKKGESVSKYIVGQDGLKGKQANGGGAGNCGNSGGGGGGNSGQGGIGGNQYNGCGGFDERGVGGLNLIPSAAVMHMGGGGGGGFRDNGQVATNGGAGGGIIYIRANVINCNSKNISSNGENVTTVSNDEGAGGGGAGGTIFIETNNYVGALTVNTKGGDGGSNRNVLFAFNCHGPGGGGGGGVFAFSPSSLPGTITHNKGGGAPGLVLNPSSPCYNTSFGAASGTIGISLPNLPITPLTIAIPTLSVNNPTICSGKAAFVSASGALTYTWSTGAVFSAISVAPLVTTVYSFTGTIGTCTAAMQSTVTVHTTPTLSVLGPLRICKGDSITILVTGTDTYTWSTGETTTTISVKPNITSTYSVNGTSIYGCANFTTATVDVITVPSITVTGSPKFVCPSYGSTLTAIGASNYLWLPHDSVTFLSESKVKVFPRTNNVYTVTGYNSIGSTSCTSTQTISVNILPDTKITIDPEKDICIGQSTTVKASGGSTYTWTPKIDISNSNLSTAIVSPTTDMVYTVSAIASGSCLTTGTVQIKVHPLPTAYAGRDTTIEFSESIVLNGKSDATDFGFEPSVENGITCNYCPSVTVSPTKTACYTLMAQSEFGCKQYDDVCVNVIKNWNLYIPNAFSPNGDSRNEYFMPKGFGIVKINLTIFDRWGLLLFEENNTVNGWDGKYRGTICKQGVYVYKVEFETIEGTTVTKTGQITLLSREAR